MDAGEPSVTPSGATLMQPLCAGSWGMDPLVRDDNLAKQYRELLRELRRTKTECKVINDSDAVPFLCAVDSCLIVAFNPELILTVARRPG